MYRASKKMIYCCAATVMIALLSRDAEAQNVCGDHNSDGSVTATDALKVLAKAIGLDAGLQCVCTTTSTTTSTTSSHADECFGDADCAPEHDWPEGYVCASFKCVECDSNSHCDPGQICDLGECVAP